MIRALITGPQPLYRLAIAEQLEYRGDLIWEQAKDPLSQPGELLERLDLLVICAGADDGDLIQQLANSSRLTPGKILLLSEYLGKRHRKLMGRGIIDLCLPLSITQDQARCYLQALLLAGRSHMVRQMLDDPEIQRRFYPDLRDLTRSERQVLFNLQKGLSNQAIADRMDICLNTAKVHLARVFRKAGFKNRNQAAGFACAQLAIGQTLVQGLF